MEIWVQGELFAGEPAASVLRRPVQRRTLGERRLRGAGWTPITRDPAIALSHGEGARLATDFRLGLARSLDQLAPESRLAIRRALASSRRGSAA
jgi:hypothetical protein